MDFVLPFCLLILTILVSACLGALARMLIRKGSVESSVQIACSSGDSEVMTFNHNFFADEPEFEKQAKIKESFIRVEARREENHAKWLKVKADAIVENEAKGDQQMKLRSVTEGPT